MICAGMALCGVDINTGPYQHNTSAMLSILASRSKPNGSDLCQLILGGAEDVGVSLHVKVHVHVHVV